MIRYQTDDEGVVSQPEYTLTKPSNGPNDRDHLNPPRLSEDRLNLPQPHSPSLPTHTALLREIGNAPVWVVPDQPAAAHASEDAPGGQSCGLWFHVVTGPDGVGDTRRHLAAVAFEHVQHAAFGLGARHSLVFPDPGDAASASVPLERGHASFLSRAVWTAACIPVIDFNGVSMSFR